MERPNEERVCSVYGHLGPVLAVEGGQEVHKGEKLGSLGRDWSRENGGFLSHLHFGIYCGEFSPRVALGYIGKSAFDEEDSRGWTDPQTFLKQRQR